MESLTEQHEVSGPVVYGYLRLPNLPAAKQHALTTAMNHYCADHELVLGGLFREISATPEAAFAGLLQALRAHRSYGVVVPAANHLGTKDIAAARRRLIDATGARLLLMVGERQLVVTDHAPRR
ncbi:hypothetical protein L1785_13850 [Antribacter sp. KLBMP9083]|uniref:Resolvase/invertase-type recombinase catalytic domain-containing protein n=1 Tax=Antribacter soli TaxID=2910976 RepID=A0AA41QF86_9MICO|nr:hypothetical protein [Antribacter soli]MCF4122062.1 hypothetical protein [Antribacter soli]